MEEQGVSGRGDHLARTALAVPTLIRWSFVAAWAALIFALSNQPGLAVSDDPAVDLPTRHLAHVAVYGVLTLLLAWALTGPRSPSTRSTLGCAVLAVLYGISDEWHQTWVPTRHGQPIDLVWDGLGAIAAVIGIAAATRIVRRRGGPGG
jgi:VanZ family protein